jgi:CIDE-N domain
MHASYLRWRFHSRSLVVVCLFVFILHNVQLEPVRRWDLLRIYLFFDESDLLQTEASLVRIVLYEDGSEVTDDWCLKSLPPQTVFVALESNEEWTPDKTGRLETLSLCILSMNMHSTFNGTVTRVLFRWLFSTPELVFSLAEADVYIAVIVC